jgi:hypothetical protein
MEEKRERGKEWEKNEERNIFEKKMKQSWKWNFKCAICKWKIKDSNLFFATFEDFWDFRALIEYLVEYASMYGEYWWKFIEKSENYLIQRCFNILKINKQKLWKLNRCTLIKLRSEEGK